MEKENIISKIEKLLNLANHPNTSEYEASSATLMAQKLILQYSIEESEMGRNKEKDPFITKSLTFSKTPIVYKFIFKVIHEATLTQTFTQRFQYRSTSIFFFGRKSNVEVAIHMFVFLKRTYQNIWENYQKESQSIARWKQAYFKGITLGILSKLRDQEKLIAQKSDATCTAIVRCKKEVEIELKKQYNLESSNTSSYYRDTEIQADGFKAGRNIDLHSAIENKKAEYQFA